MRIASKCPVEFFLKYEPAGAMVARTRRGRRLRVRRGAAAPTGRAARRTQEILAESFDPIVELATGADLMPAMVYAQELGAWDYTGMFTAVLRHRVRASTLNLDATLYITLFTRRAHAATRALALLALPAAGGPAGCWRSSACAGVRSLWTADGSQ